MGRKSNSVELVPTGVKIPRVAYGLNVEDWAAIRLWRGHR